MSNNEIFAEQMAYLASVCFRINIDFMESGKVSVYAYLKPSNVLFFDGDCLQEAVDGIHREVNRHINE